MVEKKTKRRKSVKFKIFVCFFIMIILLIILDFRIRPLVKSIAENQAKITTSKIISEEVIGELSGKSDYYSELTCLKTDNNGKILAIKTDSQKVNILKASVSSNIQKRMPNTSPIKVSVPLGTLTGVEILMGRGPMVNMKISVPGSVSTDIKSEFEQAGINQTKHRLYISVETQVYALIPGYPINTNVNTSILVSETVIVGDVPNVYADIGAAEAAALSGILQAR